MKSCMTMIWKSPNKITSCSPGCLLAATTIRVNYPASCAAPCMMQGLIWSKVVKSLQPCKRTTGGKHKNTTYTETFCLTDELLSDVLKKNFLHKGVMVSQSWRTQEDMSKVLHCFWYLLEVPWYFSFS
jgi:hypothetical protein